MHKTQTILVGSYSIRLVALSVVIAISASYAALDLGARVTAARGRVRAVWLAGGAMAMGLGIWSMHFTGMLAFTLPVPVAYHWPTVVLSLLAAVLASGLALHVVSRERMGRLQALSGSVLMGAGIAGMHYIGMAAMRLPATCHYDTPIVAVSVLIAIVASLAALMCGFASRENFKETSLAKVLSAVLMGAAISLMHYTGMASATFLSTAAAPNLAHTVSISSLGIAGIAVLPLIVQGVAVLTSSVDRQFAAQALELQKSERFHQIADNLQEVLILTTVDASEVLYVNRTYQDISGRSPESLYAAPLSWLEVIHADDRWQVEEAVRELIGGHPVVDLECRAVRPDGSLFWVSLRGYPILDAQGRPSRLVGSARDITERKLAEQALRRSETYLSEGQRLTQTGSWAWDVARQESIHWSRELFRIFGFDPAEDVPPYQAAFERIHADDQARFLGAIRRAIQDAEGFEIEFRIALPDGRLKYVLGFGHPVLNGAGEVSELVGTVMDITERKRAADELQQLSNRLLQLQDEERRRIARDLHDSTGQNLVALATMLGQLRKSLPSTERSARRLLSECKTLADGCVREVRTLSYVLHPPVLDQGGLRQAIRDYVKGFIRRSGIQVELSLSPRVGRMARDVELALFRVVQESLTNIQLHSRSRQAKIRIALDRNSDLALDVSDGDASADGLQGTAIEPKYQFGVGLPSMRERVELVGGRTEIKTTAVGTTVRVTIPYGERT